MDFGWGYNYHMETASLRQQTLWSVGPGIRYHIGTYFQFRCDYGFRLLHFFNEKQIGRVHVSAIASY